LCLELESLLKRTVMSSTRLFGANINYFVMFCLILMF
jgi:hypothetical protein